MSKWVIRGIKSGIVTTSYPHGPEESPGISPGIPADVRHTEGCLSKESFLCPGGAITVGSGGVFVDRNRCIHCFKCRWDGGALVAWDKGFQWARWRRRTLPQAPFEGSFHIRVVDAGGCGACLNEVKQLNNPFYNMHRLGLFITPTPRKADMLLVVGPVTYPMKDPLLKTYEAMPSPKMVMAVGTCALSGGLFGPGLVTRGGVDGLLDVDVEVPGCPPPPLAVLHGLLLATGRLCEGEGSAAGQEG